MKTGIIKKLSSIFREKCPYCEKGDVFYKGKPFSFPKMHEKCEHCGHSLEPEPGYFLGAMYVSYGLAVLEGILMFLTVFLCVGGVSIPLSIACIAGTILLFSLRNYRLSRVIWMHLFPGETR